MHEDIEGGQIYDRPPLPCCLAKSAVKAWGEWKLARSLPCSAALALTGSETTTLRTPWGMWSPVPEVSKGILYPHCTMHMTQRSAPIPDQAPENFDSLPAIFSGDCSEARTSNGGTSGAFMHRRRPNVRNVPALLLHGLFPYGRIARRNCL